MTPPLRFPLPANRDCGEVAVFDGGVKSAVSRASLVGIVFNFDPHRVSQDTRSLQRFEPVEGQSSSIAHCSLDQVVYRNRDTARSSTKPVKSARSKPSWDGRILREHESVESVENVGNRYLRGDHHRENHPTQDPDCRHSSATHQACPSIRNCGRQVERRCCDCAKSKSRLRTAKVRCCFRVLEKITT